MLAELALAALLLNPPNPPPPQATPAMAEAIREWGNQQWTDALNDLNGPYTEPTVTGARPRGVSPSPSPRVPVAANVEQWRDLVAAHMGANTDAALVVMGCESKGDPYALNTRSGAAGLYQFIPSTWRWVAGQLGLNDPYDAAQNVQAAAWLSKGGSDWGHWECRPNGTVVQLGG
jgi:soluble lytic murein transglycosylase-like protein